MLFHRSSIISSGCESQGFIQRFHGNGVFKATCLVAALHYLTPVINRVFVKKSSVITGIAPVSVFNSHLWKESPMSVCV